MAVGSRKSGAKQQRGRPPKLSRKQVGQLTRLVEEQPMLSLDDLVWAFRHETGISISATTARKYLLAEGLQRTRPARAAASGDRGGGGVRGPTDRSAAADSAAKVYGYGEAHRDPGDGSRYPCGLTDSEWEQVRHLFDPPGKTGRPPKYPRRTMLDACIYVLRSGCAWRLLPKDFPPWYAAYRTFRRWLAQGLFEKMYDELRRLWRSRERRAPDPTAAILDSQSVKTSPQGGEKGYDAGKKVRGRKRHLVTDTLGLPVAVLVTGAGVQDRDAAEPAMDLAMQKVPGIDILYVDGGYAGARASAIRERHGIRVEVVRHPANRNVGTWHREQLPLFDPNPGFKVLPKRWIIERTNAWNDRPRRMNKDHDRNVAVSTGWIWLAEGRRLLRRLTATPEVA
jgi:putative transposase